MTGAVFAPFAAACVIGALWLNQGVKDEEANAISARIDPGQGLSFAIQYVLVNLYRRSADEEIYFAVGSAMRGRPYDRERLVGRGAATAGTFAASARAPEADGRWHAPYAEVPIEYPPAMLPFVLWPTLFDGGVFERYDFVFCASMALLLVGAAWIAVGAQPRRGVAERGWALVALLLAHGCVAVERLDAVVALLLACALRAAAGRRPGATGAAMGGAAAVKLVPAALAPLLALADRAAWATAAQRWRGALAFGGAAAVGLAPMALVPGAAQQVLGYHAARGLQVESSLGILLGAWRALRGTSVPVTMSFGSFNFDGRAADALARACTPLLLLALAGVGVLLARVPSPASDTARRDRLALALLAGMCALWLTGKVFSPQYLTWAMPVVLAVSGERGKRLTWLLAAVMLATQVYLRGFYGAVIAQAAPAVLALVVRLGLMIAFAVAVLRGIAAHSPSAAAAKSAVASSR